MRSYNKNIKFKAFATALILLIGAVACAQVAIKTESKEFQLGDGLSFNVNDGEYKFSISGFIQGVYKYEKTDGAVAVNYFNSRNAYLTLSGSMYKEKVSFMLQNNFSNGKPLLDAWVAYSPVSNLRITFGQKQTFTNNREMTFYEDKLQFVDRGIFSSTFCNTGREFGVFFEGQIGKNNFIVKPKFAITSGDGINSFGTNSADVDKGGLKYGGRLDILPLGSFKPGNDGYIADLKHEDKLKILAGVAGSLNVGASNKIGDGHAEFAFYDSSKKEKLPNYRKFYGDILFKYKGFSLLAEYVKTSASALDNSFVDSAATLPLYPTDISQYLVLGKGINIQSGYVTKSGYSLDFKYEKLTKEFNVNSSLLVNQNGYTVGLAKYLKGNNLKIQTSVTSLNQEQLNSVSNAVENVRTISGQISFLVVF
ncbi:MAG: hypothetical protein CFE24_09745 [Flavobacterium sp. BFFFF2]|nr:MAG: hypothetical protein CFE24_09745 [Flavobacterium sp. BFFFF2]